MRKVLLLNSSLSIPNLKFLLPPFGESGGGLLSERDWGGLGLSMRRGGRGD